MWDKVKTIAGDLIALLAVVASAAVWYLVGKNRQVKDQLAKEELGATIAKTLTDNEKAAQEVSSAATKFDTDLDSYHNSLDELSSNHRDN